MTKQLDAKLDRLKREMDGSLPPLVRERMDQFYASLTDECVTTGESGAQSAEGRGKDTRKKRLLLRRTALAAGSFAVGALLVLSTGFLSPAMAVAMKRIPVVDSVFKLAGDLGLRTADERGMTTNVDQSVTHDGITLKLTQLAYDGARLSFAVEKKNAEGRVKPFKDMWHYVEDEAPSPGAIHFDFLINGQPVNTGMSIGPGDPSTDSIIVSTLERGDLQIPDTFDLTVKAYLAEPKLRYEFNVPVVKENSDSVVITTDEIKTHDNIRMRVDRVELTPMTTSLVIQVFGQEGSDIKSMMEAIPDRYKITGFLNVDYEFTDDQGFAPKMMSGGGSGEGNRLNLTFSYEPFQRRPEWVMIKPFIMENGQKAYIPELAMKLIVPQGS
ncbi:DUF4179 domain-containing protein [Paenibacillus aurantiacus]|uniref:DUF4179 domain-containing protein n=1 Tax=Paenibacillus aurantiacus TaxID=1936118 RepID=A0ABV5KU61_9BACL